MCSQGKRTKSELLFERFCQEHELRFERIPVVSNVKGMQTPDYDVFLAGERIVVEIAQLDPNENDCQYSGDQSSGIVGAGGTIGQRIRHKIKDKAPQLKARSAGLLPAILVVHNNTEVRSYTSPEHIRAAMFGFDTYHMEVPADPSKPTSVMDRKFGKGARMTAQCNRSLSALAVLEEALAGDLTLRVYHNCHATHEIDRAVLGLKGVEQYALEHRIPGQFQKWVRVEHV